MFDSERTLKHVAFFEALAGLDEADPNWHGITAGLVVLRLVDAWIDEGPHVVTADAWGVRAVRASLADVAQTTTVRAILESVVDALESSTAVEMHSIAPRLLAYAQALDYEAKWALAADVYRTILAHSHPVEDSDIAIHAYLRLGACLRQLGQTDEAAGAYGAAGQISAAVGDIIGVLRARMGDAKIAIERGNMPRAEMILDDTIQRASGDALSAVRSLALHDRSYVAYLRGDFDFAIKLAYGAFRDSASQRERDRILGDIAASFVKLGLLDSARDAYLVLATTAQEQYVRWTSVLNLLDIASMDGSEPLFERYRRELAHATLAPLTEAQFHLSVGQGYHRLGKLEVAVPALEQAISLSARHGFNQLLFEAEDTLSKARLAVIAERVHATYVIPGSDLEGIAEAIRGLRELAVTGD